ncbi:MAG: MlaD family protein [Blastocatellia bacterium]|nr:MlaD family protein [Blastocatellia bacterium]
MTALPNAEAERKSFQRGLLMTFIGFVVLGIGIWSLLKILDMGVHLYASYPNVDGLHPGSEVRISGVKVGKVRQITFLGVTPKTPDTPLVEVEFLLESKIFGKAVTELISKDSIAFLRSDGSLADRVIDIQTGSPLSGYVKDGDRITGKVEINLQQLAQGGTIMSRNFDEAQQKFTEVGQNLKQGKGTLGQILYRKELTNNLNQLSADIAAFEKQLSSGPGNFRQLRDPKFRKRLLRVQELMVKLADNFTAGQGTLGKFSTDKDFEVRLKRTADTFGRLAEKFDRLQQVYHSDQGALGKFAHDPKFHRDLKDLRQNLAAISERIEHSDGTAGKLLRDSRLSNTLANLSSELLKTLYDVRQSPSRYVRLRFSLF